MFVGVEFKSRGLRCSMTLKVLQDDEDLMRIPVGTGKKILVLEWDSLCGC